MLPSVQLNHSDGLVIESLIGLTYGDEEEGEAEEHHSNTFKLNTNANDIDENEAGESNVNDKRVTDENIHQRNDASVLCSMKFINSSQSTFENAIEHGSSIEANISSTNLIGSETSVSNTIESNSTEAYEPTNVEIRSTNTTANGETLITQQLDDEIEITYVLGRELKPKIDSFQVKLNDQLSGNLAFHENVSFFEIWHLRFLKMKQINCNNF